MNSAVYEYKTKTSRIKTIVQLENQLIVEKQIHQKLSKCVVNKVRCFTATFY